MSDSESPIRVAVLMGGPSSEHDISTRSGQQVVSGLDESFEAIAVLIGKDGLWKIADDQPRKLGEALDGGEEVASDSLAKAEAADAISDASCRTSRTCRCHAENCVRAVDRRASRHFDRNYHAEHAAHRPAVRSLRPHQCADCARGARVEFQLLQPERAAARGGARRRRGAAGWGRPPPTKLFWSATRARRAARAPSSGSAAGPRLARSCRRADLEARASA